MTKQEKLSEILKNNNGYLLTSDVVSAGISKTYMQEFIKANDLERIAHGIYASKSVWIDSLYVESLLSKSIIFSHETALYLQGLMEREPTSISLTVGRTYNASNLRKKGYKVHSVSNELLDLGKTTIKTNYGNTVRVYDIDRTICDIIRIKDIIDIQVFQTAIKEYMRSKNKNLPNLMKYAKAMNIEDKVRLYTEVLL